MNKKYVTYVYQLLIIFCAFYTGTLGAYGQLTGLEALKAPSQPKDTVHAEGVLSVDKVQPGSTFQIAIVMTFDEGWHAMRIRKRGTLRHSSRLAGIPRPKIR